MRAEARCMVKGCQRPRVLGIKVCEPHHAMWRLREPGRTVGERMAAWKRFLGEVGGKHEQG